MTIRAIRGFKDILPSRMLLWRHIEAEARKIFASYGFSEIMIPVVEKTELFKKSIGETTDIVEKEMYTFFDRHGDSLTLRPEGTAPVVRAYLQHRLYTRPISKLYYIGPMFRYERPQKGRHRQFYQIGAEVLAEANPTLDAEVIYMLMSLFERLKLKDATLNINSLGCNLCRPGYKQKLRGFLKKRIDKLCENCVRRIELNPLRALDCKSTGCLDATVDAPAILDSICDECGNHFDKLQSELVASNTQFNINPRMVRGLDYYTKTTFEITAKGLGSQNAVAAGGRYDSLVKWLGGPDTPCFGFAIGMERLAMLIKEEVKERPLLFFALFGGEEVRKTGGKIIRVLREEGFCVERDYAGKGIRAQVKRADRLNARFVLILGEDELKRGVVGFKDMEKGSQKDIPIDRLTRILSNELSPCGR